jgi:hypothetical protein
LLLERGYQVRAFVHQYDERSAHLEKQGVCKRYDDRRPSATRKSEPLSQDIRYA